MPIQNNIPAANDRITPLGKLSYSLPPINIPYPITAPTNMKNMVAMKENRNALVFDPVDMYNGMDTINPFW